jgi:hypothetical protein
MTRTSTIAVGPVQAHAFPPPAFVNGYNFASAADNADPFATSLFTTAAAAA